MKKVLLCRPHHFRVDYMINPWMRIGSVDQKLAQVQWDNLVKIYQKLGVEAHFIDQNEQYPDMVFAADQGVSIDPNNILLSRFRYDERRGESEHYKKWYESHGYRVITLPKDMYFEGGGELQRWNDQILIGTGFRTDYHTSQAVSKLLGKAILSLELVNNKFYHLDTCLMVLDHKTIFYYPPAFSEEAIKNLRIKVPNLIEITENDVMHFASNSVVIDKTVIIQRGSRSMPQTLKQLGYTVIEIDVGEFIKAGGGAHCLTGDLGIM